MKHKQNAVLIAVALVASLGWGSASKAAMNTKPKSPSSQHQEAVAPDQDTSMAYVPILLASGLVIGLAVGAGTFLQKLRFRNHAVTSKAMTEQE
ncbi:MAG: hypothetical protein ACFCU8_14250 [Thermosynechococcaceae cyanobacterium]